MSEKKQKAGIFDIRFVIGGLLGVYGVILILLGVFNATDEELARGDGLNINLWGGLGMLAVAIAFGAWARLRPVVVPVEQEPVDQE
jgi:membrane-bound ClpP family serine protease